MTIEGVILKPKIQHINLSLVVSDFLSQSRTQDYNLLSRPVRCWRGKNAQ